MQNNANARYVKRLITNILYAWLALLILSFPTYIFILAAMNLVDWEEYSLAFFCIYLSVTYALSMHGGMRVTN